MSLLGIGDEKKLIEKYGDIVKEMRKEFLYWYPVDLRTSGKDLIQNLCNIYNKFNFRRCSKS